MSTANTTVYRGTNAAPVADSLKLARVKDLQAKIQLRRTEIEALRVRRTQLVDMAAARGENRVASQDATIGAQLRVGSSLPKAKRLQQRLQGESMNGNNVSQDPQHSPGHSTANSPRKCNAKPIDRAVVRDAMADPSDPLNLPILSFVHDSTTPHSFDVFDISADQVGDIVMEIDVAERALNQNIKRVSKEIHEYEFQTEESHKRLNRLIDQQALFLEITGLPQETITTSCVDEKSASRREMDLDRSSAPAFRTHRAYEDANPDSPRFNASGSFRPEESASPVRLIAQSNTSLNSRILAIAKEMRDAQVLIVKKQTAIRELEGTIKKQKQLERSTLDIYNTIRVKDREVREQKIVLQNLMIEHERIDVRIQKAKEIEANSIEGKMTEDLANLKHQVAFGTAEDQQVHQRVTKVQEFRLTQLEKRLKLIGLALSSHHLKDDVEVMISEALELQHKQNIDSFSTFPSYNNAELSYMSSTGAGSLSTRRRGRDRAVGGVARVPFTKGGAASPSRTRAVDAPPTYSDPLSSEVAHMTEEELFDVDHICPPNERIHPAIYSLLVSEKERLDRRVGLQRILIAEKGAAMEMVKMKLDGAHDVYQETTRAQRRAAVLARDTEEEHKAALVDRVTENREVLKVLTGDHCQLKRQLRTMHMEEAQQASAMVSPRTQQ